MAEQLTTVAQFRRDALAHADPVKAQISMAMRSNTPVICLACTKTNNFGTECTDDGDMHGTVDHDCNGVQHQKLLLLEFVQSSFL